MSLDRRLRDGLHASGDTVTPDSLLALENVEGRAREHRRRRHIVQVASVAVAVMVLTIGISWTARLRAPEPPLTSDPAPAVAGAYVVDVADAAWSRNERMVGRWIVELTPNGTMEILPPDSFLGGRDGISYQINGDRLRTNAFVNSLCDATATTSQVGTYRWTLTATTLRITAINDSCHTRRMFFTSPVWLRVQ